MKLRVTKPNLYHNGKRCSVGDVITIKGDSVPKLYMGKVEAINEQGLTTDKEAGSDLTALEAENDELREENTDLKARNEELEAENDELHEENTDLKARNEELEAENDDLKASVAATVENRPDDSSPGAQVDGQGNPPASEDTGAEADAKRKAWLIDEIEKLTGERPGSNSKLDTLEAKFEKAKLAEKD